MQHILGSIIENDQWDHPIFEYDHKNLSGLDEKLYNAIQEYKPISLTDLYLKTKDREILGHAIYLANEYKKNIMEK